MTTDVPSAFDLARQAADSGSGEAFLERLVDRVGGHAGAQAVFGQPIEQGQVTVVPVARVRWAFGGGSGVAGDPGIETSSGSGGGGGVAADPVGYLEIRPDGAMFQSFGRSYPSPLFLLAFGITAAIVLRALARFPRCVPTPDSSPSSLGGAS